MYVTAWSSTLGVCVSGHHVHGARLEGMVQECMFAWRVYLIASTGVHSPLRQNGYVEKGVTLNGVRVMTVHNTVVMWMRALGTDWFGLHSEYV